MKKQERPKFYAMHKDFNDGEMKPYNVLSAVFEDILTPNDRLVSKYFYIVDRNYKKVKIRTKEQCAEYVKDKLMYHFWGNASWEFIAIDWPYRKTIDESRPAGNSLPLIGLTGRPSMNRDLSRLMSMSKSNRIFLSSWIWSGIILNRK